MHTLESLAIPENLRHVVAACISSASLSINWNGRASPEFCSSRGLRQGDPISPYLVVLCMERLGHLNHDAVDNEHWKPLHFSRSGGPKLSHMFFADYLILVAEASISQVSLIRSTLEKFYDKSGQKINL